MTDATTSAPLGIIAGRGTIPVDVAEAARAAGRPVHIIGIKGSAISEIEAFPHTWLGVDKVGRILKVLEAENCRELVIIGGVHRPNVSEARPDLGTLTNLPKLLGLLLGGDDSVLSGIVHFFESKGLTVLGAHDVAPHLLAGVGPLGRYRPGKQDLEDIALGQRFVTALGTWDVGQAAVVARRHILAVEAAEGTDLMLERCKELKQWGGGWRNKRTGVLVKCAKPTQERRVDLPAIGPETVRRAADTQLAGIAVAASDVLIAERDTVIALADEAGLFVVGIEPLDASA